MLGDLKDQIAVKKSVSVREQSTNYLGFSNKHQPPMYKLLQKEAVDVKCVYDFSKTSHTD